MFLRNRPHSPGNFTRNLPEIDGPVLSSSIGCGGGGGGGGSIGSGGGGGGGARVDSGISPTLRVTKGAGSSGITSGSSGIFDPGNDGAIDWPISALKQILN